MKKSVLFLIGVIAIISIFVVTFFGSKANFGQFKVYIDKVEILSYDRIVNGEKYLNLKWNETTGEVNLFLEKSVKPNNATEKSNIEFRFVSEYVFKDEDTWVYYYNDKITQERIEIARLHSLTGDLTFFTTGSVEVKLISKDGKERSDSVYVRCK